jgi:hypothetical protein
VSKPFYYTRNPLPDSKLNWTFEELHYASDLEFTRWVEDVCAELVRLFDETGMPPKEGKTEEKIFQDFETLVNLDVRTQYGALDEHTGDYLTLTNRAKISAADHFFPNISLAQDNIGSKQMSVMDNFGKPKLMAGLFRRNLKDDGYREYSPMVPGDSLSKYLKQQSPGVGIWFFHPPKRNKFGNKKVRTKVSEVRALVKKGELEPRVLQDIESLADTEKVFVRDFNTSKRIFPGEFRFFQTGLITAPTNFPAAVAKTI